MGQDEDMSCVVEKLDRDAPGLTGKHASPVFLKTQICAYAGLTRLRRLRQQTTMTLGWIAGKLSMGAAGSLANLLRESK